MKQQSQKPQYKAELPVNAVETNAIKIVMNLLVLLFLMGCGRLDTPTPQETRKSYKITKYTNGVYVGSWTSQSEVFLKFEDQFIQVLGDYTIKEEN